jgi:hypothetical protein
VLLHHPVCLFPRDGDPTNDMVRLQPEERANDPRSPGVVDALVCDPGVFVLPLALQSEGDGLLLELGGSLPEALHLSGNHATEGPGVGPHRAVALVFLD